MDKGFNGKKYGNEKLKEFFSKENKDV